jgi:hypothetical protein
MGRRLEVWEYTRFPARASRLLNGRSELGPEPQQSLSLTALRPRRGTSELRGAAATALIEIERAVSVALPARRRPDAFYGGDAQERARPVFTVHGCPLRMLDPGSMTARTRINA